MLENNQILTEFRKGFEYRLKPTQEQIQLFYKYSGAYRFVFNWGLALIKESMDYGKQFVIDNPDLPRPKIISIFELSAKLTQLKKQEDHLWLQESHAQALQAALKDLDFAMKNFFRRVKRKEQPGFPKFKSKHYHDAFRFPQITPEHIQKRFIHMPKIGPVEYINSRDLEGIPKNMTIKREGLNWFVSISTVMIRPQQALPTDPKIVVNMKIMPNNDVYYLLMDGNNETLIPTPTFYRDEQNRLTTLTKAMQRKVKDSGSRARCIARINKINVYIRNRRKDFLHKLSTDIVKRYNTIVINPLPIKEMIDDEQLAISLAECGWHNFCQMLRYKAAYRHKHLSEVSLWNVETEGETRMISKSKPMSFYLEDATKELLWAIYTKRVQHNLNRPEEYLKVSRSLIVNEAIHLLAQKELDEVG